MIYDSIANLQEIVGEEAHSLCWPLGSHGKERRDYFFSLDLIKGHFNCQPHSEDGSFGMLDPRSTCNCFITRGERPEKDELETADLFSYQIPDYYGREIKETGIMPTPIGEKNLFEEGRRFVILWTNEGEIAATIPDKIFPIPCQFEEDDGDTIRMPQGRTLSYLFKDHNPEIKDRDDVKPIGIWYTNSNLKRTPSVNIEDAWDTAMMTFYHPRLKGEWVSMGSKENDDIDDKFRCGYYKEPSPEEQVVLVEDVIRNDLLKTSRKFSDSSNGVFLAAYNLHDYLKYENGSLKENGFQSSKPGLFGGPQKFLDLLVEWASEEFQHVVVGRDDDIPTVLASDRRIILK